jgi:hypothetical protein
MRGTGKKSVSGVVGVPGVSKSHPTYILFSAHAGRG